MTGRLIYQDGSGRIAPANRFHSPAPGRISPTGPEAEDSALPYSRPTFNVITATTAAGYRWRWSCSLLDESGTRWRCLRPRFDFRSLDVLDRLQPRTLVRAGRDKARAQKGRPVSSFGLPPQRPSRIFRHRASKIGGSAKTTAPSATTLTIRERWRSRDGANDVARRVIDALK